MSKSLWESKITLFLKQNWHLKYICYSYGSAISAVSFMRVWI